MSFEPSEGAGNLRRERLRTARLYFVCDANPDGQDPEPLLRAALDGGVDIVQLREKEAGTRVIERAADTFRRVCDTYGVPFILNDDPELAMSVRADGVHIGQEDISVADARKIIGTNHLLGLSTHSEEQIAAAHETVKEGNPIDHISVGPISETPTKPGRPAVGLELISHAAATATIPFFAIGGINPDNAVEVLQAGARRLCVVRAIRDAADPAAVATSLRRAFAAVGTEVAPGG
ncbi:MAG: thiamine phosphate synthase [Solirubrobacterales bacterium]|nr:thiamine phosphate synthase [Solirubrobacterales bacterium]